MNQKQIDQFADPIKELQKSIEWLVENKQYRDSKGYDRKYAVFQIQVIGRLRSLSFKHLAAARKEIQKCTDEEIRELLLSAML